MRSRLRRSNPCARASATASRGRTSSWMRPSCTSSAGTKLCAPSDSRFTPHARHASSSGGFTLSGFASSVTSAPSASVKRAASSSHSRRNCRAESADGVPPPKNSDVNSTPAASGARRVISCSSATNQRSTMALEKRSVEKWQ
ncbi:MAG: hypothetical protein U0704_09430 [Candidatus Eisenbacteria bacterium]